MQVVLLERIGKLGQMGDIVTVKDGYARNFLLPKGKALRATKANIAHFETERAQLEATNLERKHEAEAVGNKLGGKDFTTLRQAGDTGQLYGSVTTRDIAEVISENGFTLERNQLKLSRPIKILGIHNVSVSLHPEVDVNIIINVARTEDEAERQLAGEDVTIEHDDEDLSAQVDEVFEDEELAADAAASLSDEAKAGDETAGTGSNDASEEPSSDDDDSAKDSA